MNRYLSIVLLLLVLVPGATACRKKEGRPGTAPKLQVVTTLYPLYDFARTVGGDRVEVRLLLPPGVEPHNFEPKPEDAARLARADLFVYTNPQMEPWAGALLKGKDNPRLEVVEAGAGAALIPAGTAQPHGGDDHHDDKQYDPHIWLDIANAQIMVANIRDGLTRTDPAGSAYYRENSAAYQQRLADLDLQFRQGLSACRQRIFLHGGHYAFGYLAQRYNLQYVSAYPLSPNAEPSPRKVMELVDLMRKNSLHAIFYEELLSPRMAETIAGEAGASLLKLHGIHNVSREDLTANASYLSLMEANLANLRKGLECR